MAAGRRFFNLKNTLPTLGVESQTSGKRGENSTTRPAWQLRPQGCKVGAQQSIPFEFFPIEVVKGLSTPSESEKRETICEKRDYSGVIHTKREARSGK